MEINKQLSKKDFRQLNKGDIIKRYSYSHPTGSPESAMLSSDNLTVISNDVEHGVLRIQDSSTNFKRSIVYGDQPMGEMSSMDDKGDKIRGSSSFQCYYVDSFRLTHRAEIIPGVEMKIDRSTADNYRKLEAVRLENESISKRYRIYIWIALAAGLVAAVLVRAIFDWFD